MKRILLTAILCLMAVPAHAPISITDVKVQDISFSWQSDPITQEENLICRADVQFLKDTGEAYMTKTVQVPLTPAQKTQITTFRNTIVTKVKGMEGI